MQKIAVVGGGLIGQGWAVVFAQSGYEVAIYDPSADVRKTVRNTIKQRIADLVSAELVTAFSWRENARTTNRRAFPGRGS